MVAAFPEAGSSSYLPGESLPRTAVRSLVLPSVCHSSQEPSHIHYAHSTCWWERGRSGCRMSAIVVPSHSLPHLTTSTVHGASVAATSDPSKSCCVPPSHRLPSTSLSSSPVSRRVRDCLPAPSGFQSGSHFLLLSSVWSQLAFPSVLLFQ